MIITIDGPAGSGKSTVAKKLAQVLQFTYFDTGAMYRAVTYAILKHKIDITNSTKLSLLLQHFDYQIRIDQGHKKYFLNNEDITEAIRTQEVTALVSEVSAIPTIRAHLVNIQRHVGKETNAVFEGRDLGTVVFPQADLKIFLSANPEVRAQRRHQELQNKAPQQPLEYQSILSDLNRRDTHDSTREHSPLVAAKDAIHIDTSHMSIDDVVAKIISLIPHE